MPNVQTHTHTHTHRLGRLYSAYGSNSEDCSEIAGLAIRQATIPECK